MSSSVGTFRGFRVHFVDKRIEARFEDLTLDDLTPGEVVIRVQWSDINYKDALAATGAGRILRKYPLVAGIDLAGVVVSSTDARYHAGEPVLVTGCDLSETLDGGYAEYARVPADAVVALPPGLTLRETMQIGTAGFTAALAIHRMEQNGQTPAGGPIVVNGATGGVGSLAIDLLAGRGYEVWAVSGKPEADAYLHGLGATKVLRRQEMDTGGGPLLKTVLGGGIDNLGGAQLSWMIRATSYGGNVASIGLAASPDLQTSVMPFILRGVNLLGINSVLTPRPLRLKVWERLATDLRPRNLPTICPREIAFADLPSAFQAYVEGQVLGRTVVKVAG
jgi:NADPH2:quinone reductase